MQKFMRNYRAEFEIGHRENGKRVADEVITISYPITCQFDINLGSYQAANAATFQFINLSPTIQAKLWLDRFEIGKKYVVIRFYAGYGETMPLVFQGYLQECLSERPSGSTEWITTMNGFEGGHLYQYGFINTTIAKGTTLADIVNYMIEQDKDVKLGYITPDLPPLPRNRTFIGQTMDILGREYGGYEVFIDKGKLNILGDNDVIPGEILVITDDSGLLGSPRRSNVFTEVTTLFEPGVRVGQAISIISDSMPRFNRAYKLVQIHHKGVISAVDSGKLTTTMTLSMLEKDPRILPPAKVTTYEAKASTKWAKPLKASYQISGRFWEPRYKEGKFHHNHKGIDMATSSGTPVYAAENGVVETCYYDGGGYGKVVYLNHGKNDKGAVLTSRYGHLTKYIVAPRQKVQKGVTIIGYVGSTGYSSGAHLHFEVRENGTAVNPANYIG